MSHSAAIVFGLGLALMLEVAGISLIVWGTWKLFSWSCARPHGAGLWRLEKAKNACTDSL